MLNQRPHGGTTKHYLTNILGLREVSLVPWWKRTGGLKKKSQWYTWTFCIWFGYSGPLAINLLNMKE